MSRKQRSDVASYVMIKLMHACQEAFNDLSLSMQSQRAPIQEHAKRAINKFYEAYEQSLTTTMYISGVAMCPTLNKRAIIERAAAEKLVLRKIPNPSASNISVDDIVAFNGPLSQLGVMVRRIAALEGEELVSSEKEDKTLEVPKGHCWMLADNPELSPPDVIDSRTLGFIPMDSIIGRVIYAGTSPIDHRRVMNSPWSYVVDTPIIEKEVRPDVLFSIEKAEDEEVKASRKED